MEKNENAKEKRTITVACFLMSRPIDGGKTSWHSRARVGGFIASRWVYFSESSPPACIMLKSPSISVQLAS